MEIEIAYRGYHPTTHDIHTIQKLINAHPYYSRRKLSILLDRKCRGLLLLLDCAGFIKLPPPTHIHSNNFKSRIKNQIIEVDTQPIETTMKELGPLTIKEVRRTGHEALCDSLIEQYHYLRFTQPVGESVGASGGKLPDSTRTDFLDFGPISSPWDTS